MEKVCSRTGKSVTLCWLAGSWMRVDKRILGYSLYVYVLCYKFTFNFGMLLVWILSSSLYLPISQSLNISLSLRDRDRADTIITLYHHTTTRNFLSTLELTYTQVWYIIGIVSSSPTHFHSEKIGLIRVTYDPPVSIRVNKYLKWLILKCDTSFESSSHALLI